MEWCAYKRNAWKQKHNMLLFQALRLYKIQKKESKYYFDASEGAPCPCTVPESQGKANGLLHCSHFVISGLLTNGGGNIQVVVPLPGSRTQTTVYKKERNHSDQVKKPEHKFGSLHVTRVL